MKKLEVKPTVISNLAFKSRPGALPGKPIKTNQDSYIIVPKFMNKTHYGFYAVADGHGLYGHLVSRYVKRFLPSTFLKFASIINFLLQEILESELRGKDLHKRRTISKAMKQAFLLTN